MTRKEQIMTILERMGYKPLLDNAGNIVLRYQLKYIFFLVNEEEEDPFVNIILPQFDDFEEGEEMLYLAACNKLTCETKMLKVFVDQTYQNITAQNITASCGFYYVNDESLEMNIVKALRILGVVHTAYHNCIEELSE